MKQAKILKFSILMQEFSMLSKMHLRFCKDFLNFLNLIKTIRNSITTHFNYLELLNVASQEEFKNS